MTLEYESENSLAEKDSLSELDFSADEELPSASLKRSGSIKVELASRHNELLQALNEKVDNGVKEIDGEKSIVVLGESDPRIEELVAESDLNELEKVQKESAAFEGVNYEVVVVKFVPAQSDCQKKLFGVTK